VKLYCIADEDTLRGFRLAGLAGQVATTNEQVRAALTRATADAECGIIILTERAAAAARAQVESIRKERHRPLIAEIPGPEGPFPGHKSLRQQVQTAVGMAVDRKE
jgi:vacuolar-type H+-ATPase subunit F/Vma7